MRLTLPDRGNLQIWAFLATFGGAMLVLAWIQILVGR